VTASASLKRKLGPIWRHLCQPDVSDVLVLDGGALLVCRGGVEERLSSGMDARALDGLLRELRRYRGEEPVSRLRSLIDDFEVILFPTKEGLGAGAVRFRRHAPVRTSLEDLRSKGELSVDVFQSLKTSCAEGSSILVVSPSFRVRSAMLVSLALQWSARRVVSFAAPFSPGLGVDGSIELSHQLGVEGALAMGAELILAEDPTPELWKDLLTGSVPFLATLNAPEPSVGLRRLSSFVPGNREQAVALVASAVHLIVAGPRARGDVSYRTSLPGFRSKRLRALSLIDDESTFAPGHSEEEGERRVRGNRTPTLATRSGLQSGAGLASAPDLPDGAMGDIRAEHLVSTSFVAKLKDLVPTPRSAAASTARPETQPGVPPADLSMLSQHGSSLAPSSERSRTRDGNGEDVPIVPCSEISANEILTSTMSGRIADLSEGERTQDGVHERDFLVSTVEPNGRRRRRSSSRPKVLSVDTSKSSSGVSVAE
jgi:hypothetical protein